MEDMKSCFIRAAVLACFWAAQGELTADEKEAFNDICKNKYNLNEDDCSEAVEALNGITLGQEDRLSGYSEEFMNAMGFKASAFELQHVQTYSTFYTSFEHRTTKDEKGIRDFLEVLAEVDTALWTSYVINPGHFMHQKLLGKKLPFKIIKIFWEVYSRWMAENTRGEIALWITGK